MDAFLLELSAMVVEYGGHGLIGILQLQEELLWRLFIIKLIQEIIEVD